MTILVLKVQGREQASKVREAFIGHKVCGYRQLAGGWYVFAVQEWAGTDYAGLIHARKAVPGVRIHCPSACSECQS